MTPETGINKPTLIDPRSVQMIHNRYKVGEDLTPGEMMTIVHLLPTDTKISFMKSYGQEMAGIWQKHIPGRMKIYEPLVENLTEFRRDVVRAISPMPGDRVFDFGAGLCPLATHIAERTNGAVSYLAIDSSQLARDASQPKLDSMVASKRLSEAQFLLHDYSRGMPDHLPVKDSGKWLGVSVFSASYFPADTMVGVVDNFFRIGGDKFFVTSLDPKHFDPDEMLDEMLEIGKKKPREEQERLAGVIAMAQTNSEGRDFMRSFSAILKKYAPLRTPEEMNYYLSQVGNVQEKIVFGKGTGRTAGFLIVPK
ncbi:MAG TPA: hypothetical protein VI819_02400 [Patescibacteria group bacterium]|nr:hypothetical protein [Patescibacteria group bacterium]